MSSQTQQLSQREEALEEQKLQTQQMDEQRQKTQQQADEEKSVLEAKLQQETQRAETSQKELLQERQDREATEQAQQSMLQQLEEQIAVHRSKATAVEEEKGQLALSLQLQQKEKQELELQLQEQTDNLAETKTRLEEKEKLVLDISAEIEYLKANLQQTADAAESATTQLREEIAAMTRAEEERKQSAEMAAMQLQLAATEADMKVGGAADQAWTARGGARAAEDAALLRTDTSAAAGAGAVGGAEKRGRGESPVQPGRKTDRAGAAAARDQNRRAAGARRAGTADCGAAPGR